MMKMIMKIKQVFILMVFVMALILPCRLNAQWGGSDGLFSDYKDPIYYDRGSYSITLNGTDGTGSGISNQQFGKPLPLGSGLIVMAAAGAGYVLLKRRKENAKN